MIEKKSAKGDLESRKVTFILIGFVIIIGLTYAGFELFATQDKKEVYIEDEEEVVVVDDQVLATDQTPPPPPPQQQQQQEVLIKLVEDNIQVSTEWDFSQDIDEDTRIEEYHPIEITTTEVVDDAPPVRFVEEMPEFPGGSEALYSFLRSNLKYPPLARESGIQGTVVVEFIVERDGGISNVNVLNSVFTDLDQEAIRVVKMMPKWKPGKHMNKAVRVFYQLPIIFNLN